MALRRHRPTPSRRALPPPGVLRRERRALLKVREERLRDLGGLLLEMFRRDHFREDLVRERCEQLLELDDRLAELDALLGGGVRRVAPGRCACGAPLPPSSHFCPNCGRPAEKTPVVACAACGHALPGDAAFCALCGAPAAAAADGAAEEEPAAEPAKD